MKVVALLAAVALVGTPSAGSQVVFRSATTSISVDVSVTERGKPVPGLGLDDFAIFDDGLAQQVTAVTRETVPIDVSCVIDLSGSVQGPVFAALTRAVNAIGRELRPLDRVRVLTFNQQVRELRPLREGGWQQDLVLSAPASLTSLFDALTVGMLAPPELGRRKMVIVFTDGLDVSSFTDSATVLELARRAGAAVFTVALTDGTTRSRRPAAHEEFFRDLSALTGGTLLVLQRDEDLGRGFTEALQAFRTSYVLTYTYEGPSRPGWHAIDVRVTRTGTFDVRARQGYFSTEAR
jgi:VWFA-related protein